MLEAKGLIMHMLSAMYSILPDVHAEYLKMIENYSPFGMLHVFLYSINTNKNENTNQIRCLLTGC